MDIGITHLLVMAIMNRLPPKKISVIINGIPGDPAVFVNENDPTMQVTPLVALATVPRQDDSDAIIIAELLVGAGACVNKRDSGPGATPLFMCAQTGKSKLMQWLLEHGARFDMTPRTSQTNAISLASQYGHKECVALLANTARVEKKLHVLDIPNALQNRTPAWVAIARGFPEIVGILCKAGVDLRRSFPSTYEVLIDNADKAQDVDIDKTERPIQHALNSAIFSLCHMSCATSGCRKKSKDLLQKCSRCHVASYCSKKCQAKDYKRSHKHVCKLLRFGMNMYGDDEDKTIPKQSRQPFGFDEEFGGEDFKEVPEHAISDDPAVWEYDTGPPGKPDWRQYPPNIEKSIENLLTLGDNKYMYRPSHPECEGHSEFNISPNCPDWVATRYIWFTDMIEREVYTGASRAVRRNGSNKPVYRRN